MSATARFHELTMTQAQRESFLARVASAVLAEDFQIIEGMSYALPEILALIEQNPMTLRKLRHLLFGPKTEKTDKVCSASPTTADAPAPKSKPKGHGRCPARHYTGARRIDVAHPTLQAGAWCEKCRRGKLRAQRSKGIVIRVVGAPPISATLWNLEKLRCDACGEVFTAPAPAQAGQEKYDVSVGVTVALLRYGSGMPHYRLARLQKSLGVPMPASTQWEQMEPVAKHAEPIFQELIGQAANSPLVHNDDTTMRVAELRRPGSASAAAIDPKRKGTFTTGIVGSAHDHPVALFFTGWQHAGENLAEVLRHRAVDLEPPIQMCDALSRNTSPEFETLLANCLAHGRRGFVEVASAFPDSCRHVLDQLKAVYQADAQAKRLSLSPQERLLHHQTHSQPVMEQLHEWLGQQLEHKKVEPNSGLGQAIGYMLAHWPALTLFLRHPGAPLDNNLCERALKMAILHRKNSLGYKTLNGARVGDLFMSLIHTCRLNEVNPFEYLLALATNADAVRQSPQAWLPWNYSKPAPRNDSG
jgi:transposase